jgi:hypothetical protein
VEAGQPASTPLIDCHYSFFKRMCSMPSLPIFLFFSGLSIGLLVGPIIVHSLKAWFSTRQDLRGN